MDPRPTIQTARLTLRPFTLDDAPTTRALAGDRDIASTTLLIPHPYALEDAKDWIQGHQAALEAGRNLDLAICERAGPLVGAIGLVFHPTHDRGEMGYWIGKPYWGRGYATEAAGAMLEYGFERLGFHKIHAYHYTRNPASGRVLEKIGMRREGIMRGHIKKWDVFEDCASFGILRADWEALTGRAANNRP
jgi:RimJ/RimL family protein N-acetyltransferase